MSRINTQDDRLVRGLRSFEQQRSFLAQPRSFQAAGSGLQGLSQALGSAARTIRTAEANVDARRKEKTDLAEYNKLLEARNRANTDPATYGDEYIEMYQSALEGREDGDPLRTRILNLDADNFVSGRIEDEEKTLRGQITTAMRKSFIELGATYDSLSDEELLEYVNLPDTDRSTRLYNEYLDSFLENEPEIHDSILEHDELELLLKQEVDRRSQSFQAGHNEILNARREIRTQDTIDGIVTLYETKNTWDETQIQALASRNGVPVETVQSAVLDRTLTSMKTDLEQGRMTLGDASEKFQFLQGKAEEYGRDAEQVLFKAQGEFISLAMQDVTNDSEGKMYSGLEEGLSLEEIVSNSDTYLLSVLLDVTGVSYGDDVSILTAEAGIGMPNSILARLRDTHKAVQQEVQAVQRARDSRSKVTVGSSYEELLDSIAVDSIRRGDFAGLQAVYGGDNPLQTAFNAGRIDAVRVQSTHPTKKGLGNKILESFEEGGDHERAWAISAIMTYNERSFLNSLSDLPKEDQIGLLLVHDALQGVDFTSVPLDDDTFIQDIQAKLVQGRTLASDIGVVGSSKVSNIVGPKTRKALGIGKSDPMSEALSIEILLSSSKLSDIELSEDDRVDRVVKDLKTSGNTIFFNAATGQYDVFYDAGVVKYLPYSEGHSREQILDEFNFKTTFAGIPVGLAPGVGETEDVVSENIRVFSGNWTPLLGSTIAEDLGITTTGPANALLEVAAQLTATKHSGSSEDEVLVEAYKNLFTNEQDSEDFLQLDIGLEGGRPHLMATGVIAGKPITGQDAIVLAPWEPHWNQSIGRSQEQLDRARKLESAVGHGMNAGLYLANPNTLGGKTLTFIQDTLEAQEEARQANPDAFKIRP